MARERMNNLPISPPPLIGRAEAIEDIKTLLRRKRLLTLIGPGGCGKTSLAIHVAADTVPNYADGAWMVELGALLDGTLLPQAIAGMLGIQCAATHSTLNAVLDHLCERQMLLIMDNCEHLMPHSVAIAEELLRACPHLHILATSREVLKSSFETVWQVPALAVPDVATHSSPADLLKFGAVQLLVERIQATLPDFTLTEADVACVTHICQQLDGIPLALELAAGCATTFSLEQIVAQLDRGFRLLANGRRTSPPRQQALEATMAWSYDLLTPTQQALFRRLSILAGEFDLTAAAAIAGDQVGEVIVPLIQLVEKSLVLVVQRRGVARYRLLETLRQYGCERLIAADEEASTWERYSAWAERQVESSRDVADGAEQAGWLDAIERQLDHLRAVLGWLLAQGRHERALRLAAVLHSFWRQRGYVAEGRHWLEAGLAAPTARVAPLVRARALNALGVLLMWQCEYPRALAAHEEAFAIFARLEDAYGVAWTQFRMGFLADKRGDHVVATEHLEDSLGRFATLGDSEGMDAARNRLGIVSWNQGDFAQAQTLLEASLAHQRTNGDAGGLASTLLNLGSLLLELGDVVRATPLLRESLALNVALRDHLACAYAYANLGSAAFLTHNLDDAAQAFHDALALPALVDSPEIVLKVCDGLAALFALWGEPLRAARIWGATEALRTGHGLQLRPFEVQHHDEGVAAARRDVDSEAFTAAWTAGGTFSLADTIAALSPQTTAEANGARLLAAPRLERLSLSPDTPDPLLRIWGLGAIRIVRGDRVLTARDLTYSRARELLFYLLSYPERTRDQIGAALWPDATTDQLRTTFRVVVYHLRRALSDSTWIVREHEYYRFNRSRAFWYDVAAFEAAVLDGERHRQAAPSESMAAFETACVLYQGDFWDGAAASNWIIQTQERLRRTYLNVLLALGDLYLAFGRSRQSLDTFLRAIDRDRFCEEAHRGVLQCYLRLHDHGQAIQHYERLRQELARELGTSPAPETSALLALQSAITGNHPA